MEQEIARARTAIFFPTRGCELSTLLRSASFVAAAFWMTLTASSQELVFRFAPPHGTVFIETARTSKELYADGQALPGEITESQTRYELRNSDDGYLVTVEPVGSIDPRAATNVADFYWSMQSRVNIAFLLDDSGALVRVTGADQAAEVLREVVPREFYDIFVRMMQGTTASEILAADWNNRAILGAFAGQTVQADTTIVMVGPVPLPSGEIVEGEIRVRHSQSDQCPSEHCARTEWGYTSRSDQLGDLMTDFILRPVRQLLSILDPTGQESADIEELLAQFRISDVQTDVEETRVTDLTTGLPHGTEGSWTVTGVMEVPGGERSEVTIVEKREHAYQYQP